MLRIEKDSEGDTTIIRLIGRIQAEHLDELKILTSGTVGELILNLEDVTLVDVQAVRFLAACQQAAIQLRNCPLYIQEWIRRERSVNT